MTLDSVIAFANVVAALLGAAAIALGFYVNSIASAKIDKNCGKLKDEFDSEIKSVTNALYARINSMGDRMQHLEGKVDDTAKRDDLHKLSLQLMGMSGDLKAMTAKMEGLSESARATGLAVKRVEDHLFKIES